MKIPGDLKVAVVGGGGREHAICWKLAQSPLVKQIFALPGNAGTARESKTANAEIKVDDFAGITEFCRKEKIDLVVIGPDNPLADGIVDQLQAAGLRAFGPTKNAARLESSKVFSKEFMVANRIPTARFVVCDSLQEAIDAVKEHPWAQVIKADGLAFGKGVFVCDNTDEATDALHAIFRERRFGEAGKRVVLEERLSGEEVSLLMFCDGRRLVLMPPSQDHKRRLEGDRGPNTGGMGAYSPVDIFQRSREEIEEQVLRPLRKALEKREIEYKGVLYAGLMIETRHLENGKKYQPYVLEFNARFGDPETQALLPLLQSDLLPILWAVTEGRLNEVDINWSKQASCCVVAATESYPESSSKGQPITLNNKSNGKGDAVLFHAGTRLNGSTVETNGGRILSVTGLGASIESAIDQAYAGLQGISYPGMSYRKDIARRATVCLSR